MSSPEKKATDKADSELPALLLRFAMNNNGVDARGELSSTGNTGGPSTAPRPRGSWAVEMALQFVLLSIHIIVGAVAACSSVIYVRVVVLPLFGAWSPGLQCICLTIPMLSGLSVIAHIFFIGRHLRRP